MKKDEEKRLLRKNVYQIKDEKVDEYIRKYVKIKNVNLTKIVALMSTTIVLLSAGVYHTAKDVSKDYKENGDLYNVWYVDDESKVMIHKNVTQDKIVGNFVIIKTPWEERKDGIYQREVYKLFSDEIPDKANDLINQSAIQIVTTLGETPELFSYEYSNLPKQGDEEVFLSYSEPAPKTYVKKTEDEKFKERVFATLATCFAAFGAIFLENYVLKSNTSRKYKVAKRKVLTLKKRKNKLHK